MSYLLDTNVFSEIRKQRGNSLIDAWFAWTSADELFSSVLTVGEIRHGIERLRCRDPNQVGIFETWLDALQQFLKTPADYHCRNCGSAYATLCPTVHGLLAATAQVHGLILVTQHG